MRDHVIMSAYPSAGALARLAHRTPRSPAKPSYSVNAKQLDLLQ
jgi:hypothetical protein